MRKFLGVCFVAAAAFVAFASYYFYYELPDRQLKIKNQSSLVIDVAAGSNLTQVLHELKDRGAIKYPFWVNLYARFTSKTYIKKGQYTFKRQETIENLLDKLIAGQVNYQSLTLIEGWNLKQVSAQLSRHFKKEAGTFLNPKNFSVDSPSLEGWIFPDTYYYSSSDNLETILNQAVRKMQRLLNQQWQLKDSGLPYKNAYEMLIMASIIEKETAVDSERELIASVFVNRLRKNMKLQTDPTVIYAMGDDYKGNIRRKHLKIESPYNTYWVKGLPPTPIAMPGLRSLQAAAKPASSPYLYFVAKGNGEHYFSRSLKEHNAAVDKYQRSGRVDNYISVPK